MHSLQDRIDIAWKPPASNGGLPVKQYIVEKKEKGSAIWQEAGKTSGMWGIARICAFIRVF